MHEKTQDAMTYVRKYGRPHLFITFTCNPSWPDIKNELMRGQSAKRGVCRFLSKQARRAKFEFIQHIRDLATKIACDVSTNLSLHCSILDTNIIIHIHINMSYIVFYVAITSIL